MLAGKDAAAHHAGDLVDGGFHLQRLEDVQIVHVQDQVAVVGGEALAQFRVAAQVHQLARCCLPAEALARLIDELDTDPCGGLLALPVADTLKRQDKDSRVAATVPRDGLWQAQTPQMFRHGLLSQALAISSSADITDEASAIERLGLCPRLVRGDASNFKVTYAQDIRLAAALLSAGQN